MKNVITKHPCLLSLPILMLLLTGCGTKHRYLYVEDAPHNTPMTITNNYDATVYPNDLLYIFVHSQSPESVKPFNEETNRLSSGKINGYLVSQSGYITFPILGRIEVAGKTRAQLGRELEAMLFEGGEHLLANAATLMLRFDTEHDEVPAIAAVHEPIAFRLHEGFDLTGLVILEDRDEIARVARELTDAALYDICARLVAHGRLADRGNRRGIAGLDGSDHDLLHTFGLVVHCGARVDPMVAKLGQQCPVQSRATP